ncbi:hypothetical protein [Frondihabitans peucedani]|uniref:Uncharacterized protein n=1 Tax=Frondihabitans peucedani TaxID=598626 RepID=A0ABP8E1H1_9MICO
MPRRGAAPQPSYPADPARTPLRRSNPRPPGFHRRFGVRVARGAGPAYLTAELEGATPPALAGAERRHTSAPTPRRGAAPQPSYPADPA